MTNNLLVEASLFAYDTFADVANYSSTEGLPKLPTGNAVDRGWMPLELPEFENPGVDLADVGKLANLPPGVFTSAAHFYVGDLEGRDTLVVTYRSTDEPNEFGFQGLEVASGVRGWDLYFAAHQDATKAALGYAADPENDIEQVLISGHSLGGIIAELTAARLVGEDAPFAELADRTLLVTLGSPGSTEVVEGVEQLNVVHTDDFVAQLSALSPLFIEGGVAREGRDLLIERPEVTLPDFAPEDLDTEAKVLLASQIPGIRDEHPSLLYIDSALLIDSAETFVPGVRENLDDPSRWLDAEIDLTIIGTDDGELMLGGKGNELIFTREGDNVAFGDRGNDVLVAGTDTNLLVGGRGNDTLVDGPGDNILFGGRGDDLFFINDGTNFVFGGRGKDTAIFDGSVEDFSIMSRKGVATIARLDDASSTTTVSKVETLVFDDQVFTLERGTFVPVEENDPSLVASTAMDDFSMAGEIA
jgi:hypothetical protein